MINQHVTSSHEIPSNHAYKHKDSDPLNPKFLLNFPHHLLNCKSVTNSHKVLFSGSCQPQTK